MDGMIKVQKPNTAPITQPLDSTPKFGDKKRAVTTPVQPTRQKPVPANMAAKIETPVPVKRPVSEMVAKSKPAVAQAQPAQKPIAVNAKPAARIAQPVPRTSTPAPAARRGVPAPMPVKRTAPTDLKRPPAHSKPVQPKPAQTVTIDKPTKAKSMPKSKKIKTHHNLPYGLFAGVAMTIFGASMFGVGFMLKVSSSEGDVTDQVVKVNTVYEDAYCSVATSVTPTVGTMVFTVAFDKSVANTEQAVNSLYVNGVIASAVNGKYSVDVTALGDYAVDVRSTAKGKALCTYGVVKVVEPTIVTPPAPLEQTQPVPVDQTQPVEDAAV